MSWRKIEKVWDEVRLAKEPKRNLSKQPKKSREVKMSVLDELHDLLTTASNISSMNVVSIVTEISDMAEELAQKTRQAESQGFLEDDFLVNLSRDIEQRKKEVTAVASDLGIDFDDMNFDYDESDIEDYLKDIEETLEAVQNVYESFSSLSSIIKG
jgi:deoxyadenosine/deoxycytidine kinase